MRVQETDAERPGNGMTARVANVIATLPGGGGQAIALMSHYDSTPDGPGAADDALGVAVCLEAGRVLAARPDPGRPLVVIVTDGEELGLMGAAAVLKDPIRNRIGAVLNFEAIGSGAPVMLFETGPRSGGLVEAWARSAPRPAGASFMAEVYKAISREDARTDLGLFKRAGIPGLGFAAVGDGYTYHTPLDVPRRLDPDALRQAGENAVAIVEALDAVDLDDSAEGATTYFDLLGLTAFAYGRRGELAAFGAAVLIGLVAWFHLLGAARRSGARPASVALTVPWSAGGLVLVAAAMTAGAWLVRATRAEVHPWYAHPARFFAWLVVAGAVGGWLARRAGSVLPVRWRGSTQPAVVWVMTLPVWMGLTVLAAWRAPSSAFLVEWPLLAAGLALLAFPVDRPCGMRAASSIVAIACAVLWLPGVWVLLHFVVPELDRSPVVTPVFAFPALMMLAGLVLVPPVLAMAARVSPRPWPGRDTGPKSRATTAVVFVAVAAAFAAVWAAPAFTADRPLHHTIRYLADLGTGQAFWEAGANEPGGVPAAARQRGAAPLALPTGPVPSPFVGHGPAPAPGPTPFRITGSLLRTSDVTLELLAVPASEGWAIAFALPSGVVPLETNLAISMRRGRQVAVVAAVPPEGVTFTGRFGLSDAGALASTEVVAMGNGIPGAAWPGLPAWLPQTRDVWWARSYFVIPIAWKTM